MTLPEVQPGDVFNGEFVLTNHGLIAAQNLAITMPEDDEYFQYELPAQLPESLGAKERIVVPYRLTCLKSPNADDDIQTGGGDSSYSAHTTVEHHGYNEYGCLNRGSARHYFFSPYKSTSGSTPTIQDYVRIYNSGGGCIRGCGGFGGGPGASHDSIPGGGEPCTPPPDVLGTSINI